MKFHTSLLNLLNSKTKEKIIRFLLTYEASMSEREIASILRISHMSVNRSMRELADMNFVNFVVVGGAHLWRVNRKSYAFKVLHKLIKEVSQTKEPLENLKETLLKNLPKALIKRVVLFGSLIKGSERPDSDIDVFIVVKNNQDKQKLEKSLDKLSNMCLEVYGNRLAPYVLTEKEVSHKKRLKIISEVNEGLQLFPRTKG